ncbi:hypothetical protein BZG36_02474 [Bifiguratus adelaidae]|uniref:Bromo domain-containing protein n=1 Tax=Bifiguratus adelaidae TaxID=1938954 RepID=A0A261Y0X1_9FUNG|nr:hypothetical protein BZG36_02474 [Bifiguratus adelaidae]
MAAVDPGQDDGQGDVFERPMLPQQYKQCQAIIRNMKRNANVGPFLVPVDPVALGIPTYFEVIEHPMDLSTIEHKLTNAQYLNVRDFTKDMELMFDNCWKFNGVGSAIGVMASNLKKTYLKGMERMPTDASKPNMTMSRELSELALWERPKREPTQVTTPPEPRRSSASADTPRPAAAPHTSTPSKPTSSNDFMSKCKHIITELQKPKHLDYVAPFLVPVDWQALNIPEYPDIIKHPMDVSTVNKKLAKGKYRNLDEFVADMRLIFNNCYTFNQPGDPVYDMGKQSEKVFDKLLKKATSEGTTSTSSMQNEIYLNGEREASSADAESRKRKPISYAEEEDEPSEDDDDDDDDPKVKALEAQLAQMEKSLEYLKSLKKRKKAKKHKHRHHDDSHDTFAHDAQYSDFDTEKHRHQRQSIPADEYHGRLSRYVTTASSRRRRDTLSDYSTHHRLQLATRIGELNERQQTAIAEMVQKEVQEDGETGEIELDMEKLSTSLLWQIDDYVAEQLGQRPIVARPHQRQSSEDVTYSEYEESRARKTTSGKELRNGPGQAAQATPSPKAPTIPAKPHVTAAPALGIGLGLSQNKAPIKPTKNWVPLQKQPNGLAAKKASVEVKNEAVWAALADTQAKSTPKSGSSSPKPDAEWEKFQREANAKREKDRLIQQEMERVRAETDAKKVELARQEEARRLEMERIEREKREQEEKRIQTMREAARQRRDDEQNQAHVDLLEQSVMMARFERARYEDKESYRKMESDRIQKIRQLVVQRRAVV